MAHRSRPSRKPEGPLLSDKQLARAMMNESLARENALKEDVIRLRWAADQLERVYERLEKLSDEDLRFNSVQLLAGEAATLRKVAEAKVKEVQETVLARRDMTRKDLGRQGGEFRQGYSTKGWGP